MERYRVRVTKDYITFSAAHFIVYRDDQCEHLHGHNYRVAAEIEDILDEHHLVFDFVALKKVMRDLTNELDHRMLVPSEATKFGITSDDKSVRISYRGKEWVLPRSDCVLLPVENTTVELLGKWFAGRLRDELESRFGFRPKIVRIDVEESPGQLAVYEHQIE